MLLTKIIDRVRYPDERANGFDDRIPYADALAGLEVGLQNPDTKQDCAETIAELKKRWAARQ